MKKKYSLLIIICLGLFSASCSDYLDVDRYFNDRQNIERIFKSKDYTEEWLANAYSQLLTHNLEIGHIQYTVSNFSDDAVFNETNIGNYSNLKMGIYYPGQYFGSWKQSYDGIRQASILIDNIDINQEYTKREIEDLKGQAYFLRGYLYWLLLKKFGPIPILPDEGLNYEDSYEELSRPRNTYDECVDYIDKQMIIAANLLEKHRDTRSAARPTIGAALAVRAKAHLYAASPLMNGNTEMADFTDHEGRKLISQTYDGSKWAKAAAAALDVIELGKYELHTSVKRTTGTELYPVTVSPPEHPVYSHEDWPEGWKNIDPFESYRSLFNGDLYIIENSEIIFTRGSNQIDDQHGVLAMTRHQMPQQGGGWNCRGVTGKQCDAYSMADGNPFDRNISLKGFVTKQEEEQGVYPHLKEGVWKEYANREPRFYASVAYSGSLWPFASSKREQYRNKQVFYYRGEQEGRDASSERWQPTGIGMMKYVHPRDSYVDEGEVYPKYDPAIRYADILLMYAEALNEVNGSFLIESWESDKPPHTITRDIGKIQEAVAPIRIRAGVPDFDITIYSEYELLKTALKRERQIELFAENQRYYDLRRWKDAPKEEGEPITGCNTFITQKNAEYFYEQVKIPHLQTVFSKKMYFWPISYEELKRNKYLTQAPGWQSFD